MALNAPTLVPVHRQQNGTVAPADPADPLNDPAAAVAEFRRHGWRRVAVGRSVALAICQASDLLAVVTTPDDHSASAEILDELGLLFASRHCFGDPDGGGAYLFRRDVRLPFPTEAKFRVCRGRGGRLVAVPPWETAFDHPGPLFARSGVLFVPPTPEAGTWDEFAETAAFLPGAARMPEAAIRTLASLDR